MNTSRTTAAAPNHRASAAGSIARPAIAAPAPLRGALHERIDVETRNDLPYRIHYRRSIDVVQSIDDTWLYRSRWWAREEARRYYKLRCQKLLLTVFQSNGAWYADTRWD
jgi:hypothetical protein